MFPPQYFGSQFFAAWYFPVGVAGGVVPLSAGFSGSTLQLSAGFVGTIPAYDATVATV